MLMSSFREESVQDRLASALRETVFRECTEAEFERVRSAVTLKNGRRRDVIVEQEAPFPYLGIVLDGVVAMSVRGAVSSQRQNRAMRLYEAFPGDLFAEVAVLDDAKTLGRASVITRSARYGLIPRETILEIFEENPTLLRELSRCAALRSRELVRRLTAQATEPIISRIAAVLLPYAADDSDAMAPAKTYLSELTQAELAATAGTVKEVAARTIAQLERDGALQRERGHIRFLCRARLREFTNG